MRLTLKFIVKHYGANVNAGITGELLFWRPNPLSVNLFSADNSFFEQCFSAASQGDPTDSIIKREEVRHTESRVPTHKRVLQEKHLHESHDPTAPAYMTKRALSGKIRRVLPTTVSPLLPIHNEAHVSKRANVPFLPGMMAALLRVYWTDLFCTKVVYSVPVSGCLTHIDTRD